MPTEITSFRFASQPKAVQNKSKYKNELFSLTLMSDPRVVRGNTHSLARKVALVSQTGKLSLNGKSDDKRKDDQSDQLPFPMFYVPQHNCVGDGIDLSAYLLEDESKNMKTHVDQSTQADRLLPRPITPPYIPSKTGLDCATQIDDQTELFNFDKEVRPLLDVIVKKTIEQSLFEVQAEVELLELDTAQTEFIAKQAEELQWMRQREEEIMEEVIRKQNMVAKKENEEWDKIELRGLVAGKMCMKQILPNMLSEGIEELYQTEVWVDPTLELIRDSIMPSIMVELMQRVERRQVAEGLFDDILKTAQSKYDTIVYRGDARKQQRVLLTFNIPASKFEHHLVDKDLKVGPFELSANDTILTLEKKIRETLTTISTVPYKITPELLQSYLSTAIGRTIGLDVPLLYFTLPNAVNIIG